jgi:hypothetical protein
MHRLSVLFLPFLLAACAGVPPQLALVSQAANGVSYVFTGKTGTDHLFSGAMKKDCAFSRAMVGRAICKDKAKDSGFAQAQSHVEGGHPGAALDRPIGQDEIVALDPVLLPREMASLAPALGGVARLPQSPVIGPVAFAAPKRASSAPVNSRPVPRPRPVAPVSRPDAAKSASAPVPEGEKAPKVAAVKAKDSQTKLASTAGADSSYYVVVGTYRNWVTALENAGRQTQGVASVVTAHEHGAKTHRVLIGPFDQQGASDTRRLVGEEGYGRAWLVRSCAGGAARGNPAGACMDLGKTWR